jgi:hypothetical protein
MERKTLERRTILKGGAAAFGMIGSGASAATIAAAKPAAGEAAQSPLPEQLLTAVERFRATIPPNFDPDYVEHAVIPFFLTSIYEGERPMLPMIDVNFSKECAAVRSLGPDLSRLEADSRSGRDGLPSGSREAWRKQPSQADLFFGSDTRSLQTDVWRQGRRLF